MIRSVRRDPIYQERARDLRSHMNDAEKLLWSRLRAHRMDGRKFRRQHALGRYIVDFVYLDARLIIEVDAIPMAPTHDRPSMQVERHSWKRSASRCCASGTTMSSTTWTTLSPTLSPSGRGRWLAPAGRERVPWRFAPVRPRLAP